MFTAWATKSILYLTTLSHSFYVHNKDNTLKMRINLGPWLNGFHSMYTYTSKCSWFYQKEESRTDCANLWFLDMFFGFGALHNNYLWLGFHQRCCQFVPSVVANISNSFVNSCQLCYNFFLFWEPLTLLDTIRWYRWSFFRWDLYAFGFSNVSPVEVITNSLTPKSTQVHHILQFRWY